MRAFLDWARKRGIVQFLDEEVPVYSITLGKTFVCVLGKYEVPTGGCDTIHNIELIYETLKLMQESHDHVLFEGLFVMNQTRGPQLAEEFGKKLVVLQLATPLATCISSINARRSARGEGALEKKDNTQDNYRRALNYCSKMRDAGARVIKVDREAALDKVLELLGAV